MVKAIYKGQILAESNNALFFDRKFYFPAKDVKMDLLENSDTHTTCSWKGEASYYNVVFEGNVNKDAVWHYPKPLAEAEEIKGMVAFSYVHGIDVVEE